MQGLIRYSYNIGNMLHNYVAHFNNFLYEKRWSAGVIALTTTTTLSLVDPQIRRPFKFIKFFSVTYLGACCVISYIGILSKQSSKRVFLNGHSCNSAQKMNFKKTIQQQVNSQISNIEWENAHLLGFIITNNYYTINILQKHIIEIKNNQNTDDLDIMKSQLEANNFDVLEHINLMVNQNLSFKMLYNITENDVFLLKIDSQFVEHKKGIFMAIIKQHDQFVCFIPCYGKYKGNKDEIISALQVILSTNESTKIDIVHLKRCQ